MWSWWNVRFYTDNTMLSPRHWLHDRFSPSTSLQRYHAELTRNRISTRSGRRGATAFAPTFPHPEEDKQLLICSLRNIQTLDSISSSVELQNRKTNREQAAEASLTPTLAFNEVKFHLRLWIFSSFQSRGAATSRWSIAIKHRSDILKTFRYFKV